jgi:glyoxylase-like metal-dependent hydrolase (beta-lactamase superfamily II)
MLVFATLARALTDTFTYQLNSAKLIALTENRSPGSTSVLIDATQEEKDRYAPDGTYPAAIHCFLYRTGSSLILFDTCNGINLVENLAYLGVSPPSITSIFITHMHPDHIGGLLNSSTPAFPNATVYISEPEIAYWKGLGSSAEQPNLVLSTYGDRIVPIQADGSPIAQTGVTAASAAGHTPGHVIYRLEQHKLVYWGDLAHAMAIQMPLPRISVTYDVDPVAAGTARAAALQTIVEQGLTVAGAHIPWPGVGTLSKDGEGYAFVPYVDALSRDPYSARNIAITFAFTGGGLVVVAIIVTCLMRSGKKTYVEVDSQSDS